jgi:glycosyltransferase involved in cell wall biosynthesis
MTPPGVSLSLVIPAYNEENRIQSLFDEIPAFDGELIVVCDGTDRTADCVSRIAAGRKDLRIRCLVFDHRLGKGGGVIEGLKAARAPLVGYFDADGSTGIGEMLMLFSRLSGPDGAIGSRWVPGSTLRVRQGILRRMESRLDSTCGCTGAIYAIRRGLFRPIHPDVILDDIAIPLLILWQGRRVVFEEKARAYDEPSRDLAEENRRKVRTLAGNFQLCRLYPRLLNPFANRIFVPWVSHKVLRLFCPWLLLVLFAASGVLARTEAWSAILFLLQAGLYVLAFAGFVLRRRRAPLILSLPAAFVSLNGAAVLGLFRFLRGGLSGRWE